MAGPGRPFRKGQSGNVKGRPPGIKELHPRNSARAAWLAVTDRNPKAIEDFFEKGLRGERNALRALPVVEMGAKLVKELGAGADDTARPVTINFISNIDPTKLRPKRKAGSEGG